MAKRLKFLAVIVGGTIGLAILYFLVAFLITRFVATDLDNKTAHKSSNEFASKQEKIDFLKTYIKFFSEVDDTEYNIYFLDNTGLIKESAKWNIKVALKISPASVDSWMGGFEETSENVVNLSTWDELNLEAPAWKRASKPHFYKIMDQKTYMVVYKDEGIILIFTTK